MQFSLIALLSTGLASLAAAYTTPVGANPSGNPILTPSLGEIVPVGVPYTIKWEVCSLTFSASLALLTCVPNGSRLLRAQSPWYFCEAPAPISSLSTQLSRTFPTWARTVGPRAPISSQIRPDMASSSLKMPRARTNTPLNSASRIPTPQLLPLPLRRLQAPLPR